MKRLFVAVCTFRRHALLKRCLASLQKQELTEAQKAEYDIAILVVDNEMAGSIQPLLEECGGAFPYILLEEPVRGYSEVRNRAAHYAIAKDASLAFIDDDEEASSSWLPRLLATLQEYEADIVTGPVESRMEDASKAWMRKAAPFKRQRGRTGNNMPHAYTHNILIDKEVLRKISPPFSPLYSETGGEDYHFTKQAAQKGFRIIWCEEAAVRETVPQVRTSLQWIAKRGYRLGRNWSFITLRAGENSALANTLLRGFLRLGRAGLYLIRGTIDRAHAVSALFYLMQTAGTFGGIIQYYFNNSPFRSRA